MKPLLLIKGDISIYLWDVGHQVGIQVNVGTMNRMDSDECLNMGFGETIAKKHFYLSLM